MRTLGIRREDKTDQERRAPVAPHHVRELLRSGELQIYLESSTSRCFTDEEYARAGAKVVDQLPSCDLVVGVKEIPLDRLQPGRPHLFFSHTIKGQSANMPLLRRILDLQCTLIDYEVVTDEKGRRLIFFGVQAGQAGMVNSLWSLGQRYNALGIATPFEVLKQAAYYDSLSDAKEAIQMVGEKIRESGMPAQAGPFICGIAGYGKVSQGAQDVFDIMEPDVISPEKLLTMKPDDLDTRKIYKVVFEEQHMVRRKSGDSPFQLQEYYDHPDLYEADFSKYLPSLSLLINAIYWTPDYPRLVTFDDLSGLFSKSIRPRLTVIGDISCDVGGSIEMNLKATLPLNPVYTVDPANREVQDGFSGKGILMMAVDILPTEIPVDSTRAFGDMLAPYLPKLVSANYDQPFGKLNLPPVFLRAVIAHRGELTPDFLYISDYLGREE